MQDDEFVVIDDITFKHETEDAILVTKGLDDIWLPKSRINYDDTKRLEAGQPMSITMPEWLAYDKELI